MKVKKVFGLLFVTTIFALLLSTVMVATSGPVEDEPIGEFYPGGAGPVEDEPIGAHAFNVYVI